MEPEYFTDALAREAERFIGAHRAEPFFLYLPWNAPHSPMQAKDASQQRFAHIAGEHRRMFAGMLSPLDDGVGRVLGALKQAVRTARGCALRGRLVHFLVHGVHWRRQSEGDVAAPSLIAVVFVHLLAVGT